MILICPTAFKGTLTASEATAAMATGARAAAPTAKLWRQPLSDGGNGLLNALESMGGGRGRAARVAGPLGTSVTARYLVQDHQAVVETAEACGVHLVPEPLRDPLRADTRGVGELLLAAAEFAQDDSRLVVGLGGSATVDAGAGMATALGWRLLDEAGDPIRRGGGGLLRLARLERPAASVVLPALTVLADVTNPLVGSGGAARVYAPQKGARPVDVDRLERALENWARVVENALGIDVADVPGGGAAGGLGAAFAALLGSPPQPGADWVLDEVGFDRALADAAVVVTGEGAWDAQSSMGKATGEVVRRSQRAGVPVLLVTGRSEAAAPAGVTVVAGSSRTMTTGDLSRLVSESLRGLLPPTRRP